MGQTDSQQKPSAPAPGNQPPTGAAKPAQSKSKPKPGGGAGQFHGGSWALGFIMGALVAAAASLLVFRSMNAPAPVASASEEENLAASDYEVVSEPVEETDSAAEEQPDDQPEEEPQAASTPTPARAPTTGSLVVVSDVKGADVFLNGKRIGKTPHRAKALKPGSYDLKVEKSGYQPYQKKVRVEAKRQQVSVKLLPASASLHIDSSVPGAAVEIDGEQRGTTPVDIADLSPGRHQVSVSADGYKTHTETLDLSGGPRSLSVDLVSPVADLNEAVAVKHKHRFGSCEGVLRATSTGIVYETDDNDAFNVALSDVETLELDDDNLRLKVRDGKTYNFNERNDNPDALAAFQKRVSEAVGAANNDF